MATPGSLISLLCTAVALSSVQLPVLGALPTAPHAPAISRRKAVSAASCDIKAGTDVTKKSAAVVANFASEVSAFICDPTGGASEQLVVSRGNAIATAEAEGFARAVASIAVDCALSGKTSVTVNGRSVAYAQAELMATAVVNAVASSDVCKRCSSRATLEARKVTKEILSAVAVAEIDLKDSSVGGDRKLAVDEFAETVVKGTATAVGELLVTAAAALDGSCGTSITVNGTIDGNRDDATPGSDFACELVTLGVAGAVIENATADASQTVRAMACEEPSMLEASAVAREVARASAVVVVFQTQQCDVGAGNSACSFLSQDINTTASAFAVAMARAVASAMSTCEHPLCVADVSAMETEIFEVVVSATQAVVSNLCVGAEGSFNRTALEENFVSDAVEALASVFAKALVDHGTCQPTAEANASISDIPNPPNPTINLTFPELPDSPAATSGPGADDPGTTAPGSFTSRDAVDSVIITPAPAGSTAEARGTATTTSSTDVTFTEACETGSCAANFKQCAGIVNGVAIAALPCCTAGFECAQQSARFGLCVREKSKLVRDGHATVVAPSCGY